MAGLNASSMFAQGIAKLHDGSIDFNTNTIRALLVKASFAATFFTDTVRDDNSTLNTINFTTDASKGNVASAHRVVSPSDIVVSGDDNAVHFASGVTSLSFTVVPNNTSCRGIVIFKSSGATRTASPLICYAHFSANVTADGGAVTVTLHANGLFKASYG